MNAVTKTEPQGQVAEYGTGLMDVIARATRDPSVDIDKMERLIAMQERVQDRQAVIAFNAALSDLQPLLPVICERGGIKDRSGNVQSTYALWEDVNEAIRPLLAEHGFALRFRVSRETDQISVTGILSHREGHSEETTLTLPTDGSGSKNAVQAVGSSTSYGKRYTAFALLNITSTGEDDDGQKASREHPISVKQYDALQKLIISTQSDTGRFIEYLVGAKRLKPDQTLEDLPAQHFDFAKDCLMLKAGKADA
jgi:hypothetical protein